MCVGGIRWTSLTRPDKYERARQIGLLLREIVAFRKSLRDGECQDWPIVVAGDFNSQPNDPSYRLLAGAPLLPVHLRCAGTLRNRLAHTLH